MTTGDALLAAVLANPADDLPRLVYADYLDDTGTDPARAEFIRLQCGPPSADAEGRANELLREHRRRWEIPGMLRPTAQRFRRGFVAGIRTTADVFLVIADHLGGWPLVTALELQSAVGRFARLRRVAWLSRVEELNLTNNVGLTDDLAEFAALPLPNLRALDLRYCQIWPIDAAAVADVLATLPRLERLNLSGNRLGNDGLGDLVARDLPALRELVFRCDEVSFMDAVHPSGAVLLDESKLLARLTHLDLAGHYLGDAGLVNLAASRGVGRLEHLDVSDNRVGTDGGGVAALVASPYLTSLRVLNLGRNRIDRPAAEALAGWDRLAAMDRIDLSGCHFEADALDVLTAGPHDDRFRIDDTHQKDAAMAPVLLAGLMLAAPPKLTATTDKADPPAELTAAVRKLLATDRVKVADADGATVAEFWLRDELPSTAAAEQVKNGLTYRELPDGVLVGAVRFPTAFVDYRKQTIPAGVYTLRFAVQPDVGDHKDTAPHPEFLLLVPAAKDVSDEPPDAKELQKLSTGATGGDHPGVMMLFPNRGKPGPATVTDRGSGVWSLDFVRTVDATGGKATLGFAVTVSGHSAKR